MFWLIYEILLCIGLACYVPKALSRRRLPHPGWSMRLGRYPSSIRQRLAGQRSVWIHAVSVGEVMAMRPLIDRLASQQPRWSLVVSTVTHTGFDVARSVVGDRGVVIYGPLDIRLAVRRALTMIQPAILILAESEFWPVMIRACRRQGIPIVVVNGRISTRAFGRYLMAKSLLRPMLRRIDRFLMQSDIDAERVIAMGAPPERVSVTGNLKWDAGMLTRPDPTQVEAVAARLEVGPEDTVIVAGSTHRGEETHVLDAYDALREELSGARLIIAPRHLERLSEVEALIQQRGHRVVRASDRAGTIHAGEGVPPAARLAATTSGEINAVVLVDTMGQLPLYYALATAVFVGGSLIPHGGQNPIEPASLGKPVVFGPFMQNFGDIVQHLLREDAARQLRDGETLASTLRDLLTNHRLAQAMGQRAQALTERLSGSSQRTLEALSDFLKPS